MKHDGGHVALAVEGGELGNGEQRVAAEDLGDRRLGRVLREAAPRLDGGLDVGVDVDGDDLLEVDLCGGHRFATLSTAADRRGYLPFRVGDLSRNVVLGA